MNQGFWQLLAWIQSYSQDLCTYFSFLILPFLQPFQLFLPSQEQRCHNCVCTGEIPCKTFAMPVRENCHTIWSQIFNSNKVRWFKNWRKIDLYEGSFYQVICLSMFRKRSNLLSAAKIMTSTSLHILDEKKNMRGWHNVEPMCNYNIFDW